MENSP